MIGLPFTKAESIGNDFAILRQQDVQGYDLSKLAILLTDRHFGIGSDGILVVGTAPLGLSLRMFNPDGTEDFCGNGLRCAGLYGHLNGLVGSNFEIQHGGLSVPTVVSSDQTVSILLPPASFEPQKVPVLTETEFIDEIVAGYRGTAVSTGSAHFVVLTNELPGDAEFFEAGPAIEHDPLFPEHISVMFTKEVGPNHLKLRIWERGAGETLGCGTGSVAAAIVWARHTGASGNVVVSNPGGDVNIEFEHWSGAVRSETRPTLTFSGTFQLAPTAVAAATRGAILA